MIIFDSLSCQLCSLEYPKAVSIDVIINLYQAVILNGLSSPTQLLVGTSVLLMLAEAINEQSGPTAEAFGYVNQVRTRAGLKELAGLDKAAFRTAVPKERRVELAFENHRWFDLERTLSPAELAAFMNAHGAKEKAKPTVDRAGIAFNALDYVYSDFEYYFPIPAPQILINNKLTQNAGYQ
jgi:hypothetical protein